MCIRDRLYGIDQGLFPKTPDQYIPYVVPTATKVPDSDIVFNDEAPLFYSPEDIELLQSTSTDLLAQINKIKNTKINVDSSTPASSQQDSAPENVELLQPISVEPDGHTITSKSEETKSNPPPQHLQPPQVASSEDFNIITVEAVVHEEPKGTDLHVPSSTVPLPNKPQLQKTSKTPTSPTKPKKSLGNRMIFWKFGALSTTMNNQTMTPQAPMSFNITLLTIHGHSKI